MAELTGTFAADKQGQSRILVILVRLESRVAGGNVELLLLKVGEPERMVLPEWPAQRCAPLHVFKRQFAQRVEWIAGCQRLVALVVVNRAVNVVGSGLGHQVDASARIAAHLCRRLRLQAEFRNRIDRQRHAGNILHTALVYRRNVMPPVIVVRAVDLPVHLVSARSVH